MLLLSALFAFAAEPPAPPAPVVPVGFVARPGFVTTAGTRYEAGTAFFVDVGSDRVLLTSLHLFGPGGGMPTQLTSAQLPTSVKEVQLKEAFTGKAMAPLGPPDAVAGAYPMDKDGAGDVVVVRIPRSLVSADLQLSAAEPFAAANAKRGDWVWVAGPVVDGPEKDQPLHRGRVVQCEQGWLILVFDTAGLDLTATAGAPVLDKDGKIVGILQGGGADQGYLFGSASPVDNIRPLVEADLKPK